MPVFPALFKFTVSCVVGFIFWGFCYVAFCFESCFDNQHPARRGNDDGRLL